MGDKANFLEDQGCIVLVSNIIKDNILLLNITKDMGVHQDISRTSVELMDYVIKPGSITSLCMAPSRYSMYCNESDPGHKPQDIQ